MRSKAAVSRSVIDTKGLDSIEDLMEKIAMKSQIDHSDSRIGKEIHYKSVNDTYFVELVRSIGGSSYCLYPRRRRALEPPLQLAEFGENVNKATSSIIRHLFCLADVFPTWDPSEIAR